jgi:pyruvate/2-oxoglutarate dehydrogenase complex dihydrolipoamide acyltransferase (E2) component
MAQDVIMPKLGMYLEDVRLVEWLCEEGVEVKAGDVIFVLETDKVTTEVEADAPGFLHRIVPADSMVPIGAVVGRIAADRAEYEELAAGGGTGGAAEGPMERAGPEFETAQSELFLDYIRTAGGDEETGGAFEPEAAPAERARPARGGRPVSPRARALIAELGLEPDVVESIPASGPGGRLTDKDVRAFLEQGGAGPSPAGERAPLVELAVAERIPLRGTRRVIARRMLESLQTTAQLTSILELDVDAVVSWRERSEPRVSYTTIFAALVAQALRRHPLLNSRIADDAIEVLADVNVGFAVNTSDGVIVPVVREVDTLGLAELDTVVSELTERARGGTLTLAELDGGTFTLSNSGNARVDITTAIINPPQAAILWLGRIRERPAAHQGAVVVRPTVQACLTYDHRIVDGVPAAEFLGTLEDLCRTLPPLFP